jgi:hypothetical protein
MRAAMSLSSSAALGAEDFLELEGWRDFEEAVAACLKLLVYLFRRVNCGSSL